MLLELHVQNLRCLKAIALSPSHGINPIIGANGSGKTSVLEAVYLLSRGRSFRHREAAPLIMEGADHIQLTASFISRQQTRHFLGMRRGARGDAEIRLDGHPAKRRSDILQLLPVQWIGPDIQQLISGPPDQRRAFLDQGMFHVEHRYLRVLRDYLRILDQRNASLRNGIGHVQVWDSQLHDLAETLDQLRAPYVDDLIIEIKQLLEKWGFSADIEFNYKRGWKAGLDLAELLSQSIATDLKQRFTGYGPHRADIEVKVGTTRSGRRLSRGQLKMVACAMVFAQSKLTRDAGQVDEILLFDDLAAELDDVNREYLIDHIFSSYGQSFVTALSRADLLRFGESANVIRLPETQTLM